MVKQRALKRVKSNRAELYLDSMLSIFVLFLCLALAITVLPVIVQKQQLDILAKEVARHVEVTGTAADFSEELDALADSMGCSVDSHDISANYVYDKNIQLRDKFTVELEKTVYIGSGVVPGIPIKLTSTAQGRSEVYWKEWQNGGQD